MLFALALAQTHSRAQAPEAAPTIVVETSRGTFSFDTFPDEAPVTVAHIVALAKAGFYDGQRVHRALPGFVVQFGDPQTKDLSKRAVWGRGDAASSGHPIGVTEIASKRTHVKGAVGLSHMGDPAKGDSQIYITLVPRHDLDNHYTVFGQVVTGVDIPAELQVGDVIRRVFVKN
ncbi:MAG TPA: peptidylprolyl isomerase [Vicinamibacterales bacterium]|nr:peptidylprolyl isomerase [Vicinamibacterales bacterium]